MEENDAAKATGDRAVAVDGPADADAGAGLDAESLRAELGALASHVEELRVLPETGRPLVHVTGRMSRGAARRHRDEVERAIVRAGLSRGACLVPVLTADGEPALGDAAPRERRSLAAMVVRMKGEDPRGLRRALRRALRSQRAVVEHLLHTTVVPERYAVELCAGIMEESIGALLALEGRESSSTESLAEVLAAGVPALRRESAVLYLQLLGLATRSRLRVAAATPARSLLPDTRRKLRELDRFLVLCEREVDETLATTRDRRVGRLLLSAAAFGALVVVGLAIGVGVVITRPLTPVRDRGLSRDSGGIEGTYFAGADFERKILRRVDEQIDFNFKANAPAERVGRDNFSIRWNGYIRFRDSGSPMLCLDSDAGSRVWVDDRLVVDAWALKRARMRCGRLHVVKGWYPLRLEFQEKAGPAKMRLLIGESSKKVAAVEPRDLCCRGGKDPVKTGPRQEADLRAKAAAKAAVP